MKFGLTAEQWQELQSVLGRFQDIEGCLLFGSRATGHHHKASDIDLALLGQSLTWNTLTKINSAFQESRLPFFVDVLLYQSLDHNSLIKQHIDRGGVMIAPS